MCNCVSYNQPEKHQKTESTILKQRNSDKTVCIDACIAAVIKLLWQRKVGTLGSCCGHNKASPSVVVDENTKNGYEIRNIIAEIDKREWKILSWISTESWILTEI